jgi:RNA polymerase sigma factor for flagellar operon FliA
LVRRIADRMRQRVPPSFGMDELMQAGLIGLNEAFANYDETLGASFETYASRRIHGAMLDALRAVDTLPREARFRVRAVRGAVHKLEHRLGRAPRAKEVSNELGWSLDEFHRTMVEAGAGGARAGDEVLEYEQDDSVPLITTYETLHGTPEHADPVHGLQQRQRHEALSRAFDALEERERYVLQAIYEGETNLREIGRAIGVSAARVSQMNEQIVTKLRRRLRDW